MNALVKHQPETGMETRQASLADLMDRFIDAQDISENSKATYRRELRQFTAWLEQTGRSERMHLLTRQDILAYKQDLISTGRSSYTVSGYMVAVRRLYEWLEAEKVYPNIAKDVKGAKKAKGFRRDCLTPSQIREALDSIDETTPEGLRDFALLNLLARTGLRTVEISRALVEDLRQEAGEAVLWVQGKGRDSKDDFVLLVDDTLRPLRDWLASRGPLPDTAPLFCSLSPKNYGQALTTRSISRIAKETFRRIGLDDGRLTAHSLRHTAVTLAIKGGASLEQAQAMARHTDPKTTLVYFHNVARVESGAERCIRF